MHWLPSLSFIFSLVHTATTISVHCLRSSLSFKFSLGVPQRHVGEGGHGADRQVVQQLAPNLKTKETLGILKRQFTDFRDF